jgi:hypothetical protein
MDQKLANGETQTEAFVSSKGNIVSHEVQQVNEHQVHQLFKTGAEGTIGATGLTGNGFTYRHDWGNRNGQHILELTGGSFTNNSMVFVAIGEGAPGGGKFIASARYTLHNVAPSNGRVKIWVNIEWNFPIRLYVDYLIINP